MNTTQFLELSIIAICAAIIPVWVYAGWRNRRVGWWALIPIVLALLPLTFNLMALFTTLDDDDPLLFNLFSAFIRLITLCVILAGGILMVNTTRRKKRRSLNRNTLERDRYE